MPWLKQPKPLGTLKRVLTGYEVTPTALADAAGLSYPTAKRRLDDPRLLTLGDLLKISQHFHIPIEELREAIKVER